MKPAAVPPADLQTAVDRFLETDWTFEHARTRGGIHGIHPYPARFIPEIPRHLIELFHPFSRGRVLDPFCGSGTTLVEAQAAGIPSFGVDLNPIATLVSSVKIDPPERDVAPVALAIADAAASGGPRPVPEIPRLDHWFTREATAALARLTHELARISDRKLHNALRVALSRIVVRVSRQDSDTRYAAVDRPIDVSDVYALFVESARVLDEAFEQLPARRATSGVLTNDILSVQPADLPSPFGLIVTSPPYPNAYEYWLYHKFRMHWLGEDPLAVRRSEIGARPHYFKKNPATADDFRSQMAQCFGLFREVTIPGAIACVVIGRSIIHGEVIDNAALLRAAGRPHGFNMIASAERTIPRTRKAFNPVIRQHCDRAHPRVPAELSHAGNRVEVPPLPLLSLRAPPREARGEPAARSRT